MTHRTAAAIAAVFFVLLSGTATQAKSETFRFDRLNLTGQHVTGRTSISVTRINAARFAHVSFAEKHDFSAPPDIIGEMAKLAGINPQTTSGQNALSANILDFATTSGQDPNMLKATKNAPAPVHTRAATVAFNAATGAIDKIDTQTRKDHSNVLRQVDLGDNVVQESEKSYSQALDTYVSDTRTIGTAVGKDVADDLAERWPHDLLQTANRELVAARLSKEDADPAIKSWLDELTSKTAKLAVSDDESSVFGALQKRYVALRSWAIVFQRINADQFAIENTFCKSEGLRSDAIAVSLIVYDRLAADPTKAVVKDVEMVDCPSRLSLTHGFGYSNIPAQQYTTSPGFAGGANVTTVQYTRNDRGRPYFMTAVGHYKLLGNDDAELHLSVAATATQSQLTGGMVGLSVSFHRALYLTAGIFRSDIESLQNGYSPGQVVPSSLSLNTTKYAVNRIGLAISFPIVKSESGKPAQPQDTATNPTAKPNSQPGGGTPQH